MAIKINNYRDKEVLHLSLPLVIGEILTANDSKIIVQNETYKSHSIIWPVINGRFKILVELKTGENTIKLQHKNFSSYLHLIYQPLKLERFVRLVYIKCKDDDGNFQAPPNEDSSIESACKRLSLAGKMLQTFTSDKLKEHDISGKTFRLEEDNGEVICHVFTSSLSLVEAYKMNEEQLWSHFALELMNSKLRVGNKCKFLAFLSFTRYENNSNVSPINHKEVLAMTKGQVALGGGGLALFGSGCLHTWPESLQQIPWRFGDRRKIDKLKLMDDSANRGWYWSCYSTGLGATLHELGHTFDLGHTNGGIMGRGFDDIHKYFIVDMFYHDHLFQKEHNPYYQQSSIHNHTVPLSMASPISWKPISHVYTLKNKSVKKDEENVDFHYLPHNINCENSSEIKCNEKPWRIPNPPDQSNDEKFAVQVGGAYWSRSSALILHFHKWFNDDDYQSKGTISMNNCTLLSPYGIRVVEFRDSEGTSIGHLEYLAGNGVESTDLSQSDHLRSFSNDMKEISFVAEDNVGNILKSKLDLEKMFFKTS